MLNKTFIIEFLCFPGLEIRCKLCEEFIKEREEEIIVPSLYYGKEYQGPICDPCYKGLPERINASRLGKFAG